MTVRKAVKEWAYDEMKEEFLQPNNGEWLEVTESFYWQALEVLPPIYLLRGFFVGEPDCDTKHGTLYAGFTKIGDRYFAKYSTRSDWLSDYQKLRLALDLSPLEGATVRRIEVLEAKHGA